MIDSYPCLTHSASPAQVTPIGFEQRQDGHGKRSVIHGRLFTTSAHSISRQNATLVYRAFRPSNQVRNHKRNNRAVPGCGTVRFSTDGT